MEELIKFYLQVADQWDGRDLQVDDTQEGIWKVEGTLAGNPGTIELREESKIVRIIITY